MQVEQVALATLIPSATNAKLHSETQIAAIAGSIREFGFTNPVLIDRENGIIAGHGRVLAARLLGLESVPCIRLAHLTDAQRRAYIIADNRLAEIGGGWDEELLKVELASLRDDHQMDLGITGFDADEILRVDEPEEQETEDEGPSGPRVSDDNYSDFSLVMEHPKKLRLIATLNAVRERENIVKLEDALMHLCDLYQPAEAPA